MKLLLRTVVYAKRTEIRNVPVFTCTACSDSEVLAYVKKDLTDIIALHGDRNATDRKIVRFHEENEVAEVLHELFLKGRKYAHVDELEKLLNDRINLLLDVLNMAQSMQDIEWMLDTEKRLKVLTGFNVGAYRLHMN